MVRRVAARPVPAVLVGAVAIAFSGVLFRLAHVSPSTGAFYRCLWALPPLYVLKRREDHRLGAAPRRARLLAAGAGVFFAIDLILWHNAIEQVGAGLATVLGNTQVVLVGVLAWLLLGERPQRSALASIPVIAVGVVLISGALEHGAYGANPKLGALYGVLTGVAYAVFLLMLRQGSDALRPAGPLFDSTLSSTVACAAIGLVVGDIDFTPSLAAVGWLVVLSLSSQVVGWLLISSSLPRLPAAITSILLTFQPVCSVVFAGAILGESPSPLQLGGAACILAGLIVATVGRRAPRVPEPELAG